MNEFRERSQTFSVEDKLVVCRSNPRLGGEVVVALPYLHLHTISGVYNAGILSLVDDLTIVNSQELASRQKLVSYTRIFLPSKTHLWAFEVLQP